MTAGVERLKFSLTTRHNDRMTSTILLTGFGPFPGAPFNPTGPLVEMLARQCHRGFGNVRRVAHVFPTSYEAVDEQLPAVLAREEPDVLLMFGLALRARTLRIETCARNALSLVTPDISGLLPEEATIAQNAPPTLPMTAPAQKLALAARATGVPAALSRDAGRYLCNYLCWRASEAAKRNGRPGVFAFIHVPRVNSAPRRQSRQRPPPFTLDDLINAGEAILQAAVTAARVRR
jgi:pyroglutamyl-peptidase